MTEEDKRPKQTAFRLPNRTLEALDKIIEEGKARTRTDALIWAVDSALNSFSIEDNDMLHLEVRKSITIAENALKESIDLEEKLNDLQKEVEQLKEDNQVIRNLWEMDIFARKKLKEMGYIIDEK